MPLPVCVQGPRLIASAVELLLQSMTGLTPTDLQSARVVVLVGDSWHEGLHSIEGKPVGLVLVGSGCPDELQRASKDGIHAFIHMQDGPRDLACAISAADRMEDYCSPSLLPALLEAVRRGSVGVGMQTPPKTNHTLSERELEIAQFASQGLSNLEIADHLHVTIATVKFHLGSAYRKTGVRGRVELRAVLIRNPGDQNESGLSGEASPNG